VLSESIPSLREKKMYCFHDRLATFSILIFKILRKERKLLIPPAFRLGIFDQKVDIYTSGKIACAACLIRNRHCADSVDKFIHLGDHEFSRHHRSNETEGNTLTVRLFDICG